MIFISYSMYSDPIRTMVKQNYRFYFTEGVFSSKNGSRSVKFAKVRDLEGLGPEYTFNEINSIFSLHHCSYRVKIHRIRYKNHHISKIIFRLLFNFW